MELLEGIRVVDFTQILAGPMASMHLGDLGAEVIKVERPGHGDILRDYDPAVGGMSAQFAAFNRNKRSVTIDLRTDRGREICYDLIGTADVVIENFKHGSAESLGIDYGTVREVNPGIIYCSVKGFASGAPYEDMPAFDMVVQAMSGAVSITGEADGPPTFIGVPVGDIAPAMYAVEAVMAALLARERGVIESEHIEVPMLNAMLAWMGIRASDSWVRDEPIARSGNTHERVAPYKVFETADSYLAVCVASENLWPKFCAAIDRPDLVDDPRFSNLNDRAANQAELYEALDDVFASRTTGEWFEVMREHGVPAGPVHDTLELRDDPYVEDQALVSELSNEGGTIPVIRYPSNFALSERDEGSDPPSLGAATDRYLRDLGYSESEIEALREDGVV